MKFCLQVDDEEHLLKIEQAAKEAGELPHSTFLQMSRGNLQILRRRPDILLLL